MKDELPLTDLNEVVVFQQDPAIHSFAVHGGVRSLAHSVDPYLRSVQAGEGSCPHPALAEGLKTGRIHRAHAPLRPAAPHSRWVQRDQALQESKRATGLWSRTPWTHVCPKASANAGPGPAAAIGGQCSAGAHSSVAIAYLVLVVDHDFGMLARHRQKVDANVAVVRPGALAGPPAPSHAAHGSTATLADA